MLKKRLAALTATIILTTSCVLAAQTTSAENTDHIQNGPTITSTGKIKTRDNKTVIDSKDMQNLSDAITNNANVFESTKEELQESIRSTNESLESTKEELQETKEFSESNAVITIDGFTCAGSSHTVTNEAIKNAKSVQVNYADENYDIVPSYSIDTEAGKITITNVKSGIVVKNIIVFH